MRGLAAPLLPFLSQALAQASGIPPQQAEPAAGEPGAAGPRWPRLTPPVPGDSAAATVQSSGLVVG